MRWIWFGVAVVCVLGTTDIAGGSEKRQLVRVHFSVQDKNAIAEFFNLEPDITAYGRDGRTVDVLMTNENRDRVVSLGSAIEVLIDDIDLHEQALRSQGYFDHFHTYSRMVAELRQAAEDHPDIAALYDIGDSWEKTAKQANRDIWALKISDHVQMEEPQEAEILYMACHHAREIITPEIILSFMHYLIDGYGSDPDVTFLVDNRQIWLVPMVNPDGHEYVLEKDIWWRKNRRHTGDNTYGVDLNRNYGYMWGYDDVGSSPRPSSILYRGLAPFSEPETQAIRDLVEAHTFVISLSYHSYGNLFLFPWGYAAEHTADHEDFVAIADSATIYNRYFSGNTKMGAIYPTNGSSDDWLYGEQSARYKILAYTPEVGNNEDGFHPDTSRIMPLIEENLWPNMYLAHVAERHAPRPVIRHTPLTDTEDVTGPYLIQAEMTSPVYPLDRTSPVLCFNTSGAPPFDSMAMNPTADPDMFEALLPVQGEEVTIYYYVSASDTVPRVGHAPAAAPESLYSFHVGLDHTPPVIAHIPRDHESVHNRPFHIETEVRDNLGVAEVELVYAVNSGPFQTTPMVSYNQDGYAGMIEGDDISAGDWISYAICARDRSAASNRARYPESGYQHMMITDNLIFTFEENTGGLTTGSGSDWQWGIPVSGPGAAYSGERVWGTGLSAPYSDLSDSRLDMPPVDLAGLASARLVFFHWYETESYIDGGNVKASVDGGLFEVIEPEEGYDGIILPSDGNALQGEPAFGGQTGRGDFWHQEVFDLSAYVGHSVLVRFHFGSNNTVRAPGWYIDDVELRLNSSKSPRFCKTVLPADTPDTAGPYIIMASILDDSNVDHAFISYCANEPDSFEVVPMEEVIPFLFRGEIPGQAPGTPIRYFLKAEDDSGNVAFFPAGAPDSTRSFVIMETAVDDQEDFSVTLPNGFYLNNYPNPFNPTTSIQFAVDSGQSLPRITLKILNILGQEIRTLVDEPKDAGQYAVTWDGRDNAGENVASGVYFSRLEAGGMSWTKSMVLLR